jgi:hypothetical protein
MAFALPLFLATTDLSANVAVVEGVNDNVVQTQQPNGNIDRHGAAFTGFVATGLYRISARDRDVHTFTLRGRSQAYIGFDNVGTTPPDGTLMGSYAASFVTSKSGSMTLSASATLTAVASARTGDGNLLLTLDPTVNGTTQGIYSAFASYSHSLSPRWTFTESVGTVVTTTISAPPTQAANGVVLERQGLDGVLPSATTTLSYELGQRDTGLLGVTYRYIYSPYSFDIAANPPVIGPPQQIHQLVPGIGLTHVFSDTVSSTTTAGLSIATPAQFETDRGLQFFPVGSQQILVTGRRWRTSALAAVSYGTISPRLGAGPSFSLVGTLSGAPIEGRAYRSLYLVAITQANHSVVPSALGDGKTTLQVFGASAELRYGLSRWLGLYSGYDVRLSTQFDGTTAPSFRQVIFLGLSGYWTTDGNLPPIETTQSPYTPG